MSLVLPAAEADLQLTERDKGALSSCVFLGMLVGGLVWGPMGDRIGELPAVLWLRRQVGTTDTANLKERRRCVRSAAGAGEWARRVPPKPIPSNGSWSHRVPT